MSTLTTRSAIAIAIAAVVSGTILTIHQVELVPAVGMQFEESIQDRSSEISQCQELPGQTEQPSARIELTPVSHLLGTNSITASITTPPKRRGPQILDAVDSQESNGRVFAIADDPFTAESTMNSAAVSEIRVATPSHHAKLTEFSRPVTTPSPAAANTLDRMTGTNGIDSVVTLPCWPANAAACDQGPCLKIDLFRDLSNQIFPQYP